VAILDQSLREAATVLSSVIALSTLIYEWRATCRRRGAAVAGLLVLAMTACSWIAIFSANVDRSPAEVMVLPPDSVSLFDTVRQPRRIIRRSTSIPRAGRQDGEHRICLLVNFPKEGSRRRTKACR